jgi:hypothetical protein
MTTVTYSMMFSAMGDFQKVLARANKKAAKLGHGGFEVSYSKMYSVEVKNGKGMVVGHRQMVDVTMTGATPSLNGWKLVGVISPLKTDTGEVLPLITTVPGETVSDAARATSDLARCDHCAAKRIRNETFIVTHTDGTEKQVGRQCVQDFLGGAAQNSAAGLIGLAGLRIELDEALKGFGFRGGPNMDADSLARVFAVTLCVIDSKGWISVGTAMKTGATATRQHVSETLHLMNLLDRAADDEDPETSITYLKSVYKDGAAFLPTAAHHEKAQQVMEAVAVALDDAEDKGQMNDYLNSCRVIHFARSANRKALGIACSMVNIGLKALGEVSDNPLHVMLRSARTSSQFVGDIGKRQTFTATLCDIIRGDEWSIRVLVTPEGNLIKTFTNFGGELGQKLTFKATPQKHSEYKGTRETVVNRVAVV